MIISRLHLINFGKFFNHEIHFNNNFNIFYGLNEAGKTTVVDAIGGVLFGFGGRRDDLRKLKARYAPRLNITIYKAGLNVAVENFGDIYIERDFLTNKAEVFTIQGNQKILSGFSAHDIVCEALGVSNFHLFRSTMLIRQEETAQLAEAEVSDILARKIMAGDQTASIKSIFRTLGRKYHELNKGLLRSVGSPGPIRQCQDEINRLTEQLEAMEKLNADYDALLTKAETLEEMVFDLQMNVQALEETISAYRKKTDLTHQYSNLLERQQTILAQIRDITQIKAELAEIEGYLETKEPYRDQISEAVLNQVSELEISIDRMRERDRLNGQQAERLAGQIAGPYKQVRSPLMLGAGILLSIFSAAGLFLISQQWRTWLLILLSTGIGLLAAGIILAGINAKNSAGIRRKLSDILGGLELEARQNYAELQKNELKLKSLLEQAGTFSPQGFRELYDAYWEAVRRKAKLELEADCLQDQNNEGRLREELAEITQKIVNIKAEVSMVSADIIDEENFVRIVREQDAQKEQLSTAQIDLVRVSTAINGIEHYALNNHDRWGLENTLSEKRKQLDVLVLKKNGIAEAVKLLRDSWREVQSGISPVIGERADGISAAITDNRWINIETVINENEFNIASASQDNNYKTTPGMLSAGTRDQVYLSVRLAIAEYLAGMKKFPLILDDPFINFDEVRLMKTVELLEEIARDHQVILLTKDRAFSGITGEGKSRNLC